MGCENIIEVMFHMLTNIKLYHWQTMSYPRHVASNSLFTTLLPLIDQFIETYIGRYKRPQFPEGFHVEVKSNTDSEMREMLETYIAFLKKDIPRQLNKYDTDLLNIRDEMLSQFYQAQYLFTLE